MFSESTECMCAHKSATRAISLALSVLLEVRYFCRYLSIVMGFPLFLHTVIKSSAQTNPSIILTLRSRGGRIFHYDGLIPTLCSENFGVSGATECSLSDTVLGLRSVTSDAALQDLTNAALTGYSEYRVLKITHCAKWHS